MKKIILLFAVYFCFSGCIPIFIEREKPAYTVWFVRNCTNWNLTLSISEYELRLAPGDGRTIEHEYHEWTQKTDATNSFSILEQRIKDVSLYKDGTLLKNWKHLPSHTQPAGFHFFKQSCWMYEFEKPDTHRWTLEIHPEDLAPQRAACTAEIPHQEL